MQLRRAGVIVPIAPKPLELLALLVRNADRMVSRKEALAVVWPDVRVSAATLASTLRDLRRALDDDAEAPSFVQTARGLGFRFIASVEVRRARSGRRVPSGGAALVGREALLERLEGALAATTRGRGGLVLLEGEPGIGKTSVLAALSAAARASDVTVCQARFPETGAGAPYRPWAQLLTTLIETRPPERLAEELGPGQRWIARLVPGLTADPHVEPVGDDDEGTTLRLFDAVTGFLRRVARSTPLVLALDDLHGADRSSLRLLEYLADEIHDSRILIAGAYRSCELDPEHPLPATLAEL
ncbi:MAG TPA: AAA family ATPase, partial [Myxococcota bacterium]|nr:AAA family ATPase [Myxococcota bacterium]